MRNALLGMALLAGLAAGPAMAAVTYSFSGIYTTDRDANGDPIATQTASFEVTLPDPVTAAGNIIPDSCTTNDARFTCSPTGQTFDPNGFGTGLAFIGLNLDEGGGSGTGNYFFDAGAFLANGTYTVFTGTITDGLGGFFGNAGSATLTVRGIPPVGVPTPMAILLFGTALAGLAIARRRPA